MLRIGFPVLAMIGKAGTARLNKAKTVLVRQAERSATSRSKFRCCDVTLV